MSRHDHPAFGPSRTPERHLHVVPDDGNAIVGVFWALMFTGAVVGLVWIAWRWTP